MPAPKGQPKSQPKQQPKGTPKQKIVAPGSPLNGVPAVYKQPPTPKAIGKQQAYIPEKGAYDKLKKNLQGDLASPADLNAFYGTFEELQRINEVGRYLFDPRGIILPDGNEFRMPTVRRNVY